MKSKRFFGMPRTKTNLENHKNIIFCYQLLSACLRYHIVQDDWCHYIKFGINICSPIRFNSPNKYNLQTKAGVFAFNWMYLDQWCTRYAVPWITFREISSKWLRKWVFLVNSVWWWRWVFVLQKWCFIISKMELVRHGMSTPYLGNNQEKLVSWFHNKVTTCPFFGAPLT